MIIFGLGSIYFYRSIMMRHKSLITKGFYMNMNTQIKKVNNALLVSQFLLLIANFTACGMGFLMSGTQYLYGVN
jgi:hypothetical protein